MRAVHVNYFVHMHFSDEDKLAPCGQSLDYELFYWGESAEHSECNRVSGIVNTLVHLVCRLLYKRQKK